jgi:hypothetical protein
VAKSAPQSEPFPAITVSAEATPASGAINILSSIIRDIAEKILNGN